MALPRDHSVFVEAFAHQGRMKGSQPKTEAQDALELITIRRCSDARLALVFADELASRSVLGRGWLAVALRTWEVEVRVSPIDDETRQRLVGAQVRQRMIILRSYSRTADG